MKPAPFRYVAPDSLDAANRVMQENGDDAKLLAGGQSLVPMMNFRLAQPEMIVDLNGVPGLDTIRTDESGRLRLGSMVRQNRLENDPLVAETAPLLHETMPYIAHPQIRNRGTLGGTLAHADPAAELPAVAVALEAQFRLQSSVCARWVDAESFFLGLFATSCEPEEILVEVALPPLPEDTGYAFQEVARRHGDYALAGVAALVSLDTHGVCTRARLVYLSAGETPMVARNAARLMRGERPSAPLFEAVAEAAVRQDIDPVSDIHATARFKRHLAAVMTRRALKRAVAMAMERA